MLSSFPDSSAPVLPEFRPPADIAASIAVAAPGASEPSSDCQLALGGPPSTGPAADAFAELLAAADSSACPAAVGPCMTEISSSETASAVLPTPCPRPSSLRRGEALDTGKSETATPDAMAMILAGLVQPAAPVSTESIPGPDLTEASLAATVPDEADVSAHPIFLRTRVQETYSSGRDVETFSASHENAPTTADDASATRAISFGNPAPAVFAEPPQPGPDNVEARSGEKRKNMPQVTIEQWTAMNEKRDGMEKAKEGAVMGSASTELLFAAAAAATSRRGMDAAKSSASFAESATESLSSAPVASPAFAAPANTLPATFSDTAPASTPMPAAAVRLIERVDEVAEHVASRSPEQVKLSLDLDGDHRVEVKVAMRGGRVFADFRTDSAEMRAALTHAWDGFVRGRDGSAQRWADPVFSSFGSAAVPAPEAAPAVSSSSGSFEGNFSSRQETSADQRHTPRDRSSVEDKAFSFAPSSASRAASVSSTQSASRSDPSRLLSALA